MRLKRFLIFVGLAILMVAGVHVAIRMAEKNVDIIQEVSLRGESLRLEEVEFTFVRGHEVVGWGRYQGRLAREIVQVDGKSREVVVELPESNDSIVRVLNEQLRQEYERDKRAYFGEQVAPPAAPRPSSRGSSRYL